MSATEQYTNNTLNILIVVDMQNDFITGSLANTDAQAIVNPIADRVRQARENGEYVIWTFDTHQNDYMDTQEGKNLPIPHCIEKTNGWKLPDALDAVKESKDVEVHKPVFGSVELPTIILNSLHDMNVRQEDANVTIIGICTDICVVSNALMLKAWLPEAHIALDASLCAGLTPEKHAAALEVMRSCQVDVFNDAFDEIQAPEITD